MMKALREKTIAALTKQVELLDKGGASAADVQQAISAVQVLTELLRVTADSQSLNPEQDAYSEEVLEDMYKWALTPDEEKGRERKKRWWEYDAMQFAVKAMICMGCVLLALGVSKLSSGG